MAKVKTRHRKDTKKVTTKAYCNNCFGETNHEVLHDESKHHSSEVSADGAVDWYGCETFETLKCNGCESIRFRYQHWGSEDTDEDGAPQIYTTYYPPAVSRREPEWMSQLSYFTPPRPLLKEIYIALRNDCRRLAAMGVRSLIEHIMIEKVGDNGSFKSNLKKLETEGYISAKQEEILESIIDAGSATTHRGFVPSDDDLATLLDITESLYETVYIHPSRAAGLKSRVPPRKK